MPLSLLESRAVTEIASVLYDFLPGKPHPYGVSRLSFPAVAQDLGLGQFWTGGSKRPAISRLVELTLEHKRSQFCQLIIELVRRGQERQVVYREDIEALNNAILGVGFKIPELHSPAFLDTLPRREAVAAAVPRQQVDYGALKDDLLRIADLAPHPRGFAFERVLHALFASCGLAPKGGFRNTGEQIDGSFEHEGQTYLLEAKWLAGMVGISELLTFQGKVEGKAAWTRGLFVSHSAFSPDALEAFKTGRSTRIVCMDGLDLWQIVDQQLDFGEILSGKAREAAQSNRAFVRVRDLFTESRG